MRGRRGFSVEKLWATHVERAQEEEEEGGGVRTSSIILDYQRVLFST